MDDQKRKSLIDRLTVVLKDMTEEMNAAALYMEKGIVSPMSLEELKEHRWDMLEIAIPRSAVILALYSLEHDTEGMKIAYDEISTTARVHLVMQTVVEEKTEAKAKEKANLN